MIKELATSVLEKEDLGIQEIEIVHSDMRSQYTSDLFDRTLKKSIAIQEKVVQGTILE